MSSSIQLDIEIKISIGWKMQNQMHAVQCFVVFLDISVHLFARFFSNVPTCQVQQANVAAIFERTLGGDF